MQNETENQEQERPVKELDALTVKAKEFEDELDALSEKYKVNILAAVSFKEENQTGVFYSGDQNLIIELGLAKVIETKFNN